MADDEIDCDALIAPLARKPSLERLKATYIRRYANLTPDEIADCIHDAIENLFQFCRRKRDELRDPSAVEAMLHAIIRNRLIDALRHNEVLEFVTYDDDYVALGARRAPDDDDAREPESIRLPGDDQEPEKRRTRKLPPSRSDDEGIEAVRVEHLDVDRLLEQLMRELDERTRRVVRLLLFELTPAEIAAVMGKDRAYRVRDWARVKVCRVLGRLSDLGNDTAERLYLGGKCPALLAAADKPAM
jgi:RNA polymerase sigma factor (sigma-70 family)